MKSVVAENIIPNISICIPAYKNVSFLKRLLDSIAIQSYKDYEVVISDDSPDRAVQDLVETYHGRIERMVYQSNAIAYGMPENWNKAIERSTGQWKKIMHDDDWFVDKDSLALFAAEADRSGASFIFSNYINKNLEDGKTHSVVFPKYKLKELEKNPLVLMAGNLIGPPSVCMVHETLIGKYNSHLHWLVDIDYYIQIILKGGTISHIGKELVYIGVNQQQITNAVKNDPKIEIGEAKVLLDTYGVKWLKNPFVYDGWWRLFRNMGIENEAQLIEYGGGGWPALVKKILAHQKNVPQNLIKIGPFSKVFMILSYLRQYHKFKEYQ